MGHVRIIQRPFFVVECVCVCDMHTFCWLVDLDYSCESAAVRRIQVAAAAALSYDTKTKMKMRMKDRNRKHKKNNKKSEDNKCMHDDMQLISCGQRYIFCFFFVFGVQASVAIFTLTKQNAHHMASTTHACIYACYIRKNSAHAKSVPFVSHSYNAVE